jgi:RNA recognition motif-containing protein
VGNKLYVGNLAYSVRDDSLLQAFAQFGTVTSAKVMMDRETGRSKGFGFVEMSSSSEAQKAITMLHGKEFQERTLTVNVARPREENSRGGGGGGYDNRRSSSSSRGSSSGGSSKNSSRRSSW